MRHAPRAEKAFLDPLFLSKLRKLDLVARLVVEGFITGLHRSPYHGFSVEFAEHRPYMPGDPIRFIDWKVYAKSDRFYIKEFEEETNLRTYLLLDTSSSMTYRSNERFLTKLQYATFLAAALAYLMLKQQDSVGLLTFGDKIKTFVPPRSVPSHLRILLGELERPDVGGETRIGDSLKHLVERITRRGLVILLSDLIDSPEHVMMALKHFRHRKHEVIVFHVLDPAEIEFPFREEAIFVDLETSEKMPTLPWEIAREYKGLAREWRRRYKYLCAENRIDFVEIETSTPYDVALLRYLEKRQRLY